MKLGRQSELVTSEPGWTANMFELVRDRAAKQRDTNEALLALQTERDRRPGVAVSVSMSCRLAQVLFVLFSLSLSLCLLLALYVLCNK